MCSLLEGMTDADNYDDDYMMTNDDDDDDDDDDDCDDDDDDDDDNNEGWRSKCKAFFCLSVHIFSKD